MKVALFTWAFIQSFLIGGLLLINYRNKANKCLSLFFLLVGAKVLGQYLMRFTSVKFSAPSIIFLADIIDFIEPVLLLFYLRALFDLPIKQRQWSYFAPGAVMAIFAVGFILYVGKKDLLFDAYISSVPHRTVLLLIAVWKCFVLFKVHLLIYGKNKVAVATKQQKTLLWPKLLAVFLLVSTLVSLCYFFYHMLDGAGVRSEPFRQILEYNYILYNSSLVLATGYFFLEEPKLFKGAVLSKPPVQDDFPGGDFYFKKMEILLQEDKIYLNSELNEHQFAEAISLQPYLLSKLINQHLGKSYSELINECRINEAKELLSTEEGQQMTIYAVALESGFRSESVFYTNFKKMTGMTPSQFKKSQLIQ